MAAIMADRRWLRAVAFTAAIVALVAFAAIYRIAEKVSGTPHFVLGGEPRALSFGESPYFSLVIVSTVGYGDIVPASDPIRAIASVQIVLGVLLLLFGFFELIRHAQARRGE